LTDLAKFEKEKENYEIRSRPIDQENNAALLVTGQGSTIRPWST
jgi:hypothetical protein